MGKTTEITEYFVFHKEWYDLKKTVSKKVWDELLDLMLQLRFDGIDTDPQTIKNKTVRSYWVMMRVRILNSMKRCEEKKKERKKNNTDLPPNTDFEEKAENSPNKATEPQNDIVIPQEEESVSEAPKQGEFDNTEERFNNRLSERLEKFIYKHQDEIQHNIDVISKYNTSPNTVNYMTLEKAERSMARMISQLGVGTKDAKDLEELYCDEIERATAAIVHQNAMR